MATLPAASTSLTEAAGAIATGIGMIAIMGCVATNADTTPRVFANADDLIAEHGYSEAVDYAALHIQKTRKPVIFLGLPIVTAGFLGQQDTTGVTGTSALSVAAAAGGVLTECHGQVIVKSTGNGTNAGVVGTDQFLLTLSLDGGWSTQNVRLGTGTSYTIPNSGIVLNVGAGTLNVGDVFTFASFAPMWGSTAIDTARIALAGQESLAQSWMVVGDLPNSTFAGYVRDAVNTYETSNQRFVYARAQVGDKANAKKSQVKVYLIPSSGAETLTFAASGHTITRSAGSWITDGFQVGDMVTIVGGTSNVGTIGPITVLTATVMTFGSGVVNEGPTADTTYTVTGSEELTFAAGTTITRTVGSWLNDGFAVGQTCVCTNSVSNNVSFVITTLTATVLTAAATTFVSETAEFSSAVKIVATETQAAFIARQNAAFATIDAQKRVDLGAGRARVNSPITGWTHRRPCQWGVSAREYTHDVQIPTYRKEDGPLDGFQITDSGGRAIEFDERVNGGGLAARFTCLCSYNSPKGAFVALSLTRDTDGKVLSRTHNMAVADVMQTVIQTETENAIGQVLVLNDDGTGTDASLALIEGRVNTSLQKNLLQNGKEGQRASSATWTASRTDVLNVPGATLNGKGALNLDGTLEQINTSIAVS